MRIRQKGIQMTLKIQSPEGQEVLAALISFAQNNDRKLLLADAWQEIPATIPFDITSSDITEVLQAYTSDSQICDPQQGKIACIFMDDGNGEYRLTADDETCEALKGVSGSYVSPNSIPGDDVFTTKEVQAVSDQFNDMEQPEDMRTGYTPDDHEKNEGYDPMHSMDVYFQLNGEDQNSRQTAEADGAVSEMNHAEMQPSETARSVSEENLSSMHNQMSDEERYAIIDDYPSYAHFDRSDQAGNYAPASEDAENFRTYNAIKEAAGLCACDQAEPEEKTAQTESVQTESVNPQEADLQEAQSVQASTPEISEQEMLLSESMTGDDMAAISADEVRADDAGYTRDELQANLSESSSEELGNTADAVFDSSVEPQADAMSIEASGTMFAAEPADVDVQLEEAGLTQDESVATGYLDEEDEPGQFARDYNENSELLADAENVRADTDMIREGNQEDLASSGSVAEEETAFDERQDSEKPLMFRGNVPFGSREEEEFSDYDVAVADLRDADEPEAVNAQAYDINYASDLDTFNQVRDQMNSSTESTVDRLRNTEGDLPQYDLNQRSDMNEEAGDFAAEDESVRVTGLDGVASSVWTCVRDPQLTVEDADIEIETASEESERMDDLRADNAKLNRKISKAQDRIVQQERKIFDHNGQIDRNTSNMMKSVHESQIRHNKKVIDRKERKISKLQDQIDQNNQQLR